MKVKELIDILNELDVDKEIQVEDSDAVFKDIHSIRWDNFILKYVIQPLY